MSGANCIDYLTASATIDGTSSINLAGSTAVNASIPSGARGCIITLTGSGIRWRCDGGDTTTGTGHYQAANSSITFDSWTAPENNWKSVLRRFKFSPSSSGTVSLGISYFD